MRDGAAVRVGVVHFTPVFAEPEHNVQRIVRLLEAGWGQHRPDVVVFPELAVSGYFFQSSKEILPLAWYREHPAVRQLMAIARRRNMVIVIGAPEKVVGQEIVYNSAWIFEPSAEQPMVYRKVHLFYREKQVFAPGNLPFAVYAVLRDRVRLGVMICYDFRFPEVARSLVLQGADCILVPANFVTPIWQEVMKVRAIENKVYIAVANRGGAEARGDETLRFCGPSTIVQYNGQPMAVGESEGTMLVAEIFPKKVRSKQLNLYNDLIGDRRPEFYQKLCEAATGREV